MMLLQFRASGAEPSIAVAIVGLSALSLILSLSIAAVLVRGYRRGPGRRGMLWLAVGLLMLTTVPELLRVGLPTFSGVGSVTRSVIVSACELLGLGTILWTVYGGRDR